MHANVLANWGQKNSIAELQNTQLSLQKQQQLWSTPKKPEASGLDIAVLILWLRVTDAGVFKKDMKARSGEAFFTSHACVSDFLLFQTAFQLLWILLYL